MVIKVNRNISVGGRLVESTYVNSTGSPRVNGKLVLKPQPFYLGKYKETMFVRTGTSFPAYGINQWGTGGELWRTERSAAIAQARARLIGKIHFGDSSLGVTLGSAAQSRAMIITRLRDIYKIFLRAKSFERKREFRRDFDNFHNKPLGEIAKGLADTHLEWIFGWVPLVADIHAAMGVLTGDLPSQYLRGVGFNTTDKIAYYDVGGLNMQSQLLNHRAVWSTEARVSNPNLWLANRLGLINPAVVAWDLVPWSFVVNMFVNVNQVLKGFSDLLGLELTNSSVTVTTRGTRSQTYRPSPYYTGSSSATHTVKWIERTLGLPPGPSLTYRAPEFNMSLALMAGALVTQQVHRISSGLKRNS